MTEQYLHYFTVYTNSQHEEHYNNEYFISFLINSNAYLVTLFKSN